MRGGMRAREAQKARLLARQYEQLQEIWAENAMLFHDMENHLQTIRYLAQEGRNEEISAYIANIIHPRERLSGILWTGIGIVDAVLNEKRRLAQERGLRLDINAQLPGNTGIAEDDFCTILANLLDNAIESAGGAEGSTEERVKSRREGRTEDKTKGNGLPEGNRIIEISMRHIHHFLVIRVVNPCGAEPVRSRGLFATSKGDGLRHGWGLKSVQRAARRYDGSLSCEVEEGRFVATVILFFRNRGGTP